MFVDRADGADKGLVLRARLKPQSGALDIGLIRIIARCSQQPRRRDRRLRSSIFSQGRISERFEMSHA
jgi:hypothetical protein